MRAINHVTLIVVCIVGATLWLPAPADDRGRADLPAERSTVPSALPDAIVPLYPYYYFVLRNDDSTSTSLLAITCAENYAPQLIPWHPTTLEGCARHNTLIDTMPAFSVAFAAAENEVRARIVPPVASWERRNQSQSTFQGRRARNWHIAHVNAAVSQPRQELAGRSIYEMLHLKVNAPEAIVQAYGSEHFDPTVLAQKRAERFASIAETQRGRSSDVADLFSYCTGVGIKLDPHNPWIRVHRILIAHDSGYAALYAELAAKTDEDIYGKTRGVSLHSDEERTSRTRMRLQPIIADLRDYATLQRADR